MALLRAILLTLNHSAIPNETSALPPVQAVPPSDIVAATGLMYASLLISLLAAFFAMLGKQWLNRYLRNAGGSMIERCGDRQRKCDGLQKWHFHLFVESLPVILQVSLLLLALGLYEHMRTINTSIGYILIILTMLGIMVYIVIVIAGASSYECPFQTPASTALCTLWEKTGPHITAALLPIIAVGGSLPKILPWPLVLAALHHMREVMLRQIRRVLLWLPPVEIGHPPHNPSLPTAQPTPLEPGSWLSPLHGLWENIQCKIFRTALRLPRTLPPSTIQDTSNFADISPWLTPTALTMLRETNATDVRCVSWILRRITDPEALDMGIGLAGTIRWFEDGLDVKPPYDLIVSTFRACFDSTGKVQPGLSKRAYYSAQAVLWIHVRAMCVSEEFARGFPLPVINHDHTFLDDDLKDLLGVYRGLDTPGIIAWMCAASPRVTPVHQQRTSVTLLNLSWANRSAPDVLNPAAEYFLLGSWDTILLGAILNRLLTWCIFLGWPVEEEVLKIQDKSCVIPCSVLRATHTVSPDITPNRSYLTYLKRLFQPSTPRTLDTISFHICCAT